jgi:hypothetical protein
MLQSGSKLPCVGATRRKKKKIDFLYGRKNILFLERSFSTELG